MLEVGSTSIWTLWGSIQQAGGGMGPTWGGNRVYDPKNPVVISTTVKRSTVRPLTDPTWVLPYSLSILPCIGWQFPGESITRTSDSQGLQNARSSDNGDNYRGSTRALHRGPPGGHYARPPPNWAGDNPNFAHTTSWALATHHLRPPTLWGHYSLNKRGQGDDH